MTGNGRIRADRLRASESLYGPRRAQRPSDTQGQPIVCPFCPGNEAQTGTLLTADPGLDWQSRVIANLYPAVVEPDGRHEVIVELRAHDAVWTALDAGSIERILHLYRARETAAYGDGYRAVPIFKNSGAPAGASLLHPHTQVLALRAIPRSVAARLDRLTLDCDVCATVLADGPRSVARSAEFLAYVPNGSRTAFEVRIAAFEHTARFSSCSDTTLADLAKTLRDVLKRLAVTLGEGFPFNMIVQSAPCDARAESLMHWEIELVPRNENFGGFEVGTGGFMVSRAPEDAAGILRGATARSALDG